MAMAILYVFVSQCLSLLTFNSPQPSHRRSDSCGHNTVHEYEESRGRLHEEDGPNGLDVCLPKISRLYYQIHAMFVEESSL